MERELFLKGKGVKCNEKKILGRGGEEFETFFFGDGLNSENTAIDD